MGMDPAMAEFQRMKQRADRCASAEKERDQLRIEVERLRGTEGRVLERNERQRLMLRDRDAQLAAVTEERDRLRGLPEVVWDKTFRELLMPGANWAALMAVKDAFMRRWEELAGQALGEGESSGNL